MSVHFSSQVWKLQTESANEKLVLLKLADNANDQGECWPSIERMAMECNLDIRTVQRVLRAIEKKSWICTRQRLGHSSVYQLILPTPGHWTPPANSHPTPGTVTPPPPANSHPEPSVDPSRNRQVAKTGKVPTLPPELSVGELPSAWAEWEQHRLEKRKPITPTSAKENFRQFSKWGITRSVAAIRHSIRGGYQGIFEDRNIRMEPDPARRSCL